LFCQEQVVKMLKITDYCKQILLSNYNNSRVVDLFIELNYITHITIQNIAKACENICVQSLDSTRTPFFYYFKSCISKFCKTITGNTIFLDLFL